MRDNENFDLLLFWQPFLVLEKEMYKDIQKNIQKDLVSLLICTIIVLIIFHLIPHVISYSNGSIPHLIPDWIFNLIPYER